jgi:hypothetical protein
MVLISVMFHSRTVPNRIYCRAPPRKPVGGGPLVLVEGLDHMMRLGQRLASGTQTSSGISQMTQNLPGTPLSGAGARSQGLLSQRVRQGAEGASVAAITGSGSALLNMSRKGSSHPSLATLYAWRRRGSGYGPTTS